MAEIHKERLWEHVPDPDYENEIVWIKENIYQLLRGLPDLQCGNLGQAISNSRDVLWLMFITMPASKYTLFAPAVEQYEWFHASCGGPSIIPPPLWQLLFSAASCFVSIFHFFFFFLLEPSSPPVSCRYPPASAFAFHSSACLSSLVPPSALSISPTQSLLSHGPRCSVRCLLHSACGLVRKPVNPGLECIGQCFFLFFCFFFCQKHNSEPLDTNTLEEHFFFVGTRLSGTLLP